MTVFDSTIEATKKAALGFPKWMDIRKRLKTSVGGKYLSAVIEEDVSIKEALEEYKNGFFLKYYIGREDEILCHVMTAHIGILDSVASASDDYEITEDVDKFSSDRYKYVFYTNGYLVADKKLLGDADTISYYHGDVKHSARLKAEDLWNIFDEFAMFSGLTRYEGETNIELENRIFAAYKRPTNSTDTGLKNAIINSIMNYDHLSSEEISIEFPNGENMLEEISPGVTIYDALAPINRDSAKEKVWDQSDWENTFKKTTYIPNIWDADIKSVQNGTGQRNDLKVALSTDILKNDKTDIEVIGYTASTILINDYIRKQGIHKTIPLRLEKYNDELNAQDIEYKLTATPAKLIDHENIRLKTITHSNGEAVCYLDDVILNRDDLQRTSRGSVPAGATYDLVFYPKDPYSIMEIRKCVLSDGKNEKDLLVDKDTFKHSGGTFFNTDVRLHVSNISELKNVRNLKDKASGGFTVDTANEPGQFSIDVYKMDGQPITVRHSCKETNYTNNSQFVSLDKGFNLVDDKTISSAGSNGSAEMTIELDCTTLSFTFDEAGKVEDQGSITVRMEIDGELSTQNSGLITRPQTLHYDFGNLKHVKLYIVQSGVNPVSISSITASRYRITTYITNGALIETQKYIKLPAGIKKGTMLQFMIESFSTFSPVIEYVHIGPSLAKSTYTIENIKTGKGGFFDIDTECRVELRKHDGESVITENEDFITKPKFENISDDSVAVFLDLSSFKKVESCSVPLYSGSYRGVSAYYIVVTPGEEIDSISISGEHQEPCENLPLSHYLKTEVGDKVYVSGNAGGFIILKQDGSTAVRPILRSELMKKADEFEFIGLDKTMSGLYAVNESANIQTLNNKTDKDFNYCWITTLNGQEYTAYNETRVFQSPFPDVDIVNTFSPYLDPNLFVFYRVSDAAAKGSSINVTCMFKHTNGVETVYEDWALGGHHDGLEIRYDTSTSNENMYQLSIDNLNESFTISNNIELKNTYMVNNVEYELARYIVTPPDNMRITYRQEKAQQHIIIKEDGFNKLWYSNVDKILSVVVNGKELEASHYDLLSKPGIITWKNADKYVGTTAVIIYSVNIPDTMEFKDLSYLYEMVGYSVDAYAPLNEKPLVFHNLKNDDTQTVMINGEIPDKMTVRCTNANFEAVIAGNQITVHRIAEAASAIVHSGYYYVGKNEYYLAEHDHQEKLDSFANIDMERVRRVADALHTRQRSSNFVYDTSMTSEDHEERTCMIDCTKDASRIDVDSSTQQIAACESYQLWNDFSMDISMTEGFNGLGLKFTPKGKAAYALFELTPYLSEDCVLSFVSSSDINAAIMQEKTIDGAQLSKTTYVEKLDSCTREQALYIYHFKDMAPDKRYYLMITGEGMVDDIIVEKYAEDKDYMQSHIKNISSLDFDIKENVLPETELSLMFDSNGNSFDGLEIDHDGIIETGSNVDWDVTLLKSFSDEFGSFKVEGADLRKNVFYSGKTEGRIVSPWMDIPNYRSAKNIYVKVNDVMIDPMRFFGIRLYGADDMSGTNEREIAYESKTNLLIAEPVPTPAFLRIEVEMPAETVIKSVEIYARFVENDIPLRVAQAETGSLTTKIYNTTVAANYRLKRIIGSAEHLENIRIDIRGYRQDDEHGVWTEWYECPFDETLTLSDNAHIFEDYQYFQLRVSISDMMASIKIDELIFEVV